MATVLIVDDARPERELLSRVVAKAGHRAILAETGEEALDLAREHKPSLIFLDVVLPVQDGFATCRQLTKDPETSSIPVVFVTSKCLQGDVFWGKKQGASDHVSKPWDPARVGELLRRYCR